MANIQYGNIDKTRAPGYKGIGSSGFTSSGGEGGTPYDPHIYMIAGENVFAGQVLQVRTVEETITTEEETITTEYIVVNLDELIGGHGVVIDGVSYKMEDDGFGNFFIDIKGVIYQVKGRYDAQHTLIRYIDYETTEALRKCFIQNAKRGDHNKTIGIAVADTEAGELCQIAGNGLNFDYTVILENKELPAFEGVQLFGVNNDTVKNFNVDTEPDDKDNHLIIVGSLTSPTSVFINIQEYQLQIRN